MTNKNDIERKCLRCIHGIEHGRLVKCGHWFHPGVVGGCGTEWVIHCANYSMNISGKKAIITQKIEWVDND